MHKPPSIRKEEVPLLLDELRQMKLGALLSRYRELYGEPSRSKNKGWLVRRLAWRTQELAEGGLPPSVLRKISELGDCLPERWRIRMAERAGALVDVSTMPVPRDPRLPTVGSVLRRVFRGKAYSVKVIEAGFELDGAVHPSLSAAARAISKNRVNGFQFFGLKPGSR